MFEYISLSILALGSVGTLIGAWYVYKTLRANHDWQRRQYAIDIFREWNANTAKHAQAIERAFPHIRDVDRTTGKSNEITKEQAKRIYTCDMSDAKNWELRFHIIELLNYLEFVTTAYSHNVADKTIILSSLKNPLVAWHNILKNFIETVNLCEDYKPWQPFSAVVNEWEHPAMEMRKPTA